MFGDAVTTKDDRPVTERIKTFEDACKELGEEHPLVKEWNCWQGCCSADLAAYLKLHHLRRFNEGWEPQFTEDEWRYYPLVLPLHTGGTRRHGRRGKAGSGE